MSIGETAAHAASDIAVIGMACRFPGADDPDTYWRLLVEGREAVEDLSDADLAGAGVDPALSAHPRYVRRAPRLRSVAEFDADAFNLSVRDAELLDPQHRLLLECAWEALERAGRRPDGPEGAVGVFAGCGVPGYLVDNILPDRGIMEAVGPYAVMLANDKDFLATRVAYALGLTGPACTVQTACSTGLVAVHMACGSLLAGECAAALAGASSLRLPEGAGYLHQPGMVLSPDGRCRPFDAAAGGTVGGSGAAVVVLRLLEDALRDGDPVLAVVKGSAVNNDGGDKVGYTAPSVSGQAAAIRQALAVGGVDAGTVGFVEAHGTGTPLGDPIELTALNAVFAGAAPAGSRLLGSVKSNLGHLDAAAGLAGFIKAVLAVRHGVVPPTLHFRAPNPECRFEAGPFRVSTEVEPWPAGPAPRRAGVSSFGIGGTNAHAVVEAPPSRPPSPGGAAPHLVVLSGRSAAALDAAAARLADELDRRPELDLAAVAETLAAGRKALPWRRAAVCRDLPGAVRALRAPAAPQEARCAAPAVAFAFPGQGTQRPGMAAGLHAWAPVFRREVDRCCDHLADRCPGLRDVLLRADAPGLDRTALAQPALFAFGWALARQWIAWGIEPSALIGHSLGEFVAAALAGVIDPSAALDAVAERGRLMQGAPEGRMLAVGLSEAEATAFISGPVALAAVNGPRSCTVAGPVAEVEDLAADLARRGVGAARLGTDRAFHSAAMDEAALGFARHLRSVELRAPAIPFVSGVTGGWITDAQARDPAYWARQMREPVCFAAGAAALFARHPEAALVETGPGRVLGGLARAAAPRPARILASTAPEGPAEDPAACLDTIGALWTLGAEPLWPAVHPGPRRRLALPPTDFRRKRHWVEPPARVAPPAQDREVAGPSPGAPGVADAVPSRFRAVGWRRLPRSLAAPPGPLLVFADGSPLSDTLAARSGALTVRRGEDFVAGQDAFTVDPDVEDHWRRLVAELGRQDRLPAAILYLWSLSGTPDDALHRPMALARALEGAGRRPSSLVFATYGAQDVLGGEVTRPTAALAVGPARVVRAEMPWIASRCVDLAADGAEGASLLLAEAAAADAEPLVAHRGAHRWAPTLDPVDLPAGPGALRERGLWLVLGGLGGIGRTLALALAGACRARLALVGRSAGAEAGAGRRARLLDDIRAAGGDAIMLRADASEPGQMRAALAAAESRFGPLRGVVHAAGVAGGGVIARRSRDAAAAVIAAKTGGIEVLADLLRGRDLDAVALCSSLTGLAGEAGQADYCAANAALDAWAHRLRGQGLPAVAIDWPAWREVGMAAETPVPGDMRAARAASLAAGLAPDEGAAAFLRIIGSGLAQVVLLPAATSLDRAGPSPSAAPPPPARSGPPPDDVEASLARLWSDLLGVPSVGPEDDFFALGGHSLLATRILAAVARDFRVDLSLADVFQNPTVRLLAEEVLLRRLMAQDPGALAAALDEMQGTP